MAAWSVLGLTTMLVLGFAWAERTGWPFLAQPLARWLSTALDREVRIGTAEQPGFALHLWGGIQLQLDHLQVANPAWSRLGPMVQASQAELRLRYGDLLRHRAGQALPIESLEVQSLNLQLERQADGRASWQIVFAKHQTASDPGAAAWVNGVRLGRLSVRSGTWQLQDALTPVALSGDFQVDDGQDALADRTMNGLVAHGRGQYRDQPFQLQLRTGSTTAWWRSQPDAQDSLAVQMHIDSGRSQLRFEGAVANPSGAPRLSGHYTLHGPSLADLGRPLHITLPATRAVALQGWLSHQGELWHTVIDRATIGRSQLSAALQLRRTPGQLPELAGRLTGKVLWLEDLGPAIGMPADGRSANRRADRVLPDRPFDLPSLRAMDAQVLVSLDRLESGSPKLKAVAPLTAQIKLHDAVLDIREIDARLAQGRIRGQVQLDGRSAVAQWRTDLRAQGLELADWINQARQGTQPPYVSGRLAARVQLTGSGRSTAQILGSAQGQLAAQWTRGRISHLVVEAAGIDIAQGLGVFLKGDDALPVNCGAAALQVKAGVARPEVLLVDTRDSTLWAEGTASLADERLDLAVHVSPKDKSPLTLRTPIHLTGAFNAPKVSLDKAGLARRVVPAALLALLNPLAGLLPLVDLGDSEAPRDALKACHAVLAQRLAAPRL